MKTTLSQNATSDLHNAHTKAWKLSGKNYTLEEGLTLQMLVPRGIQNAQSLTVTFGTLNKQPW